MFVCVDVALRTACLKTVPLVWTGHCIEPGGDRQKSHVDFPCHVRSGAFWEDDPDMLKQYFTSHQLNHVLPHFSVQVRGAFTLPLSVVGD